MKKILVVLALLFVSGLAFSVTGDVHARLDANGTIHQTEWGTLDDISMAGRSETGFDINFDSFGFHYLLRSDLAVPASLGAAYGAAGVGSLSASSPGYFEVTGIKLGSMALAVGASFWHFDETKSAFATNALGATNANAVGNIAFNHFAVNAYYSIPLSDTMKLQTLGWDQIQIDLGMGSSSQTGIATNSATHSMFNLYFPIYLEMTFDKLSLEIYPKLIYGNSLDSDMESAGTTNATATLNLYTGALVRVGYPLNDQWSIYAHVGVFALSSGSATIAQTGATATTNASGTAGVHVPIFAGFAFKPAGWSTWNLGIGYVVKNDATATIVTSGSTATTNIVTSGGGLENIYHENNDQEHAYAEPFLNWGGSAKFASDWTLAFTGIMLLNSSQGFADSPFYTSSSATGTSGVNNTSSSQLVHFTQIWDWDGGGAGGGACYIQYAKDAVSLKFVMGGNGTGGSSIMGMFGFVDMSINF